MADYDYVDHATAGTADYYGQKVCAAYTSKHFVWKRSINLATAGDAMVSSTGAFSAADTLAIFNVIEGIIITYAVVEVITGEGATCTADLGDGADPNGYLKLFNLETAAWYQPDGTYGSKYMDLDTPTHGQGKLYITADTIDITFTHNSTDVAVADYWIAGTCLSPIYVA